ncbi:hypothetical protein DFQ28_004273 [Apophysomyces sp. BC1034]|nr:hypothetical protein DFQ30_003617 [Apophysomyces sp. BC1015]KAG0182018.1 hypothetical protein DFQ29_006136 [Apophysomyces sp. BC1021]KAG0193606.1 hypothetical protein DFQ28_004273 [Apophysomyces sp. BC1034]
MNPLDPSLTSLLLQDIINAPAKAEDLLDRLTSDQILMIETTISRVKRRKLDRQESQPPAQDPTAAAATAIASALAAAMTSAALQPPPPPPTNALKPSVNATSNEPVAEVRDGVEWVSFVYSHNRTLKRYSIRTDISTVALDAIDEKFKTDNCVYPRANLPKEAYKGNRWAYETECNVLGWKLAWLNAADISGKRGLIQRAVDSYRNRYPSMRSRRVARQEKLLNGTLRKRKNREGHPEEETLSDLSASLSSSLAAYPTLTESAPSTLAAATVKPAHHPKTIAVDDATTNTRFRIKINVENVHLDEINQEFRKANCAFPRAVAANPDQYAGGRTRWLEETMCNELGWKLAWLNPRLLAGKKNLLQRALDVYRGKFMPALQPRKHSTRAPPIAPPSSSRAAQPVLNQLLTLPTMPTPLTASALSAQNALFAKEDKAIVGSPALSCISGTTASLDFGDCFSLADEASTTTLNDPILAMEKEEEAMYPVCDLFGSEPLHHPLLPCDESSTTVSCSSSACTPSPPATSDFFGLACDSDLYDSFMLPPVNDSFMLLDNSNHDEAMETKYYDPLASPSLPSSAVQQDLVKMEEDLRDGFAAGHLLDPLF